MDKIKNFVNSLSYEELNCCLYATKERIVSDKLGYQSLEEGALKLNRKIACPNCKSTNFKLDGFTTKNKKQRYKCRDCGKRFQIMSDSIFNSTKLNLVKFYEYVQLMIGNVQLELIESVVNISHKTALLWRHKIFKTVENYQNKVILSNTVWLDEIYIHDTKYKHEISDKKLRGLSKEQICIVLGIDVHKNLIAKIIGNGKSSSSEILSSLQDHIKPMSLIKHDGDFSHTKLISYLNCSEEVFKSIVKDKDYEENMSLINSFSSWIKRYLYRFIGMNQNNLQSYLNWFVYLFRVKNNSENFPPIERIIRHLILDNSKMPRTLIF